MGIEEFHDWQSGVDRFFEAMEVFESNQVKMVAIRLKNIDVVWWDRLVAQRRTQHKGPVQTWRRLRQLMTENFLHEDYEQILYRMYIDCQRGEACDRVRHRVLATFGTQ